MGYSKMTQIEDFDFFELMLHEHQFEPQLSHNIAWGDEAKSKLDKLIDKTILSGTLMLF